MGIEISFDAIDLTDEQLLTYMKESTSVDDWNSRRRNAQAVRSPQWVGEHLDASGLIVKVLGRDEPRYYGYTKKEEENGDVNR